MDTQETFKYEPNFLTDDSETQDLNIVPVANGSVMIGGSTQSLNFLAGVSGWKFDADGNIYANNGTFIGTITASAGTIAGFVIGASSLINDTFKFGIRSADGTYNIALWIGETDTNRFKAPFRITNAGIPIMEGLSGANRYIEGRTTVAGVSTSRWQLLLGDNTAESGSDAGSDFKIIAYNDNGVLNLSFYPLVITRSNGLVTIGKDLSVSKLIKLSNNPGSNQTAQGPGTDVFNAGGSITVMDLVYLGSSSTWLQTDANALSTSGDVLVGISLETKTVGNAMRVALPGSFVRNDSWSWTPGAVLYLSETAAGITATVPTTSGAIIRKIGYAVTATSIYFNPSDEYSIAP